MQYFQIDHKRLVLINIFYILYFIYIFSDRHFEEYNNRVSGGTGDSPSKKRKA